MHTQVRMAAIADSVSSAAIASAQAQTVTVTPRGSQDGGFCRSTGRGPRGFGRDKVPV